MKAIAIGIVEVNPLVEIGDCCSCVHIHVSLLLPKLDTKSYPPIPTFIWLSILDSLHLGFLLFHVLFFDHDDTMVWPV